MEALSHLVRKSIAGYFANIPVPESFGGFIDLSVTDWFRLLTFAGGVSVVVYAVVKTFVPKKDTPVNLTVQKDSTKVVHSFDLEDLGDKVCYCRCWRSKKFPLCDGSHTKHNELTGDNVGPLVVKRREPAKK